jgi:hypothetical protein
LNVTFQGFDTESGLRAFAGASLWSSYSLGIGAPPGGRCDTLRFVNGTYEGSVTGFSSGIGSSEIQSWGSYSHSRIRNLVIENGLFNITSGPYSYGPAIGAGSSGVANSTIDVIDILNGAFILETCESCGPGIGSGLSRGAASAVRSIRITEGDFNISAAVGIGAVWASEGQSFVGDVSLQGGHFAIRGMGGAGIGAGEAMSVTSRGDAVDISGGSYMIEAGSASEFSNIQGRESAEAMRTEASRTSVTFASAAARSRSPRDCALDRRGR